MKMKNYLVLTSVICLAACKADKKNKYNWCSF